MSLVIDYSGKIAGADLVAAKVESVCRYFNPGLKKSITAAEAADLHAHGVGIVALCETSGDFLLTEIPAAVAHTVQTCLDYADTVGVGIRALYLAADWAVTPDQYATLDAALAAAAGVLGLDRLGLYGRDDLLTHAQAKGLTWLFRSAGWNTGQAEPAGLHLRQLVDQMTIAGVTCDVDQAVALDYGQWPAPQPTQPPGDDMSAADVAEIEKHEDATIAHAVDEIRTDTAEGNSNANVRAHQDAQGNELADLFAYARQHFAALEDTVAAIVKHPALAAASITEEPAGIDQVADVHPAAVPAPAAPVDQVDADHARR